MDNVNAGCLTDSQAQPPAGRCDRCQGEIYRGVLYHRIDGFSICADCFFDFAFDYFADCMVCCGTPGQEGCENENV